jgi:hypothetical protein
MSPMTTTQPPATRRPLPGSLFFIFTGQGNNGKTEQMMRLMSSRWPDGTPAIAPFLLLVCEASTEGTAGPVIDDESMCLVWPVADFDEAKAVLAVVFPEGKPPLKLRDARLARQRSVPGNKQVNPARVHTDELPIGGVAVESASTLLRAQKTMVRETAREEGKKFSVSGKALENDQKRIAGIATGPAQDFVDALSGVSVRNRGVVVCVAVHTKAQIQLVKTDTESKEIAVGEAPDFGAAKVLEAGKKVNPYSDLWNALNAKANIGWHLFGDAPDFTAEDDLSQVNRPGKDVLFGAVTMRGRYPFLGAVLWPKRQGGEGWLSEFDRVPRVWSPDVPWPEPVVGVHPSETPGHVEFAVRTADLPGGRQRGYDGSPDAGLVFELCLRNLAERAGGA